MAFVSVTIPFEDNWYFETLLHGLGTALEGTGHEVRVRVQPPGPTARAAVTERLEDQLADPGCVGAIVMHFLLKGEHAQRVRAFGKPVVLVGGRSVDFPVVRIDDVEIARRAVQHLLDLGHRHIAHLGGSAAAPDDFTIRADRVRGYSEAMGEAGLETLATVRASAFELEAAKRQAVGLLQGDDRPTAVFAAVDDIAFGVLAAAAELGIEVPRDLSVIGIDDHERAADLGLTTIRQDPAEVGRAAVERLLGSTHDDDQVVGAELVVRRTTAPPRSSAGPPGLLSRLLRRRG